MSLQICGIAIIGFKGITDLKHHNLVHTKHVSMSEWKRGLSIHLHQMQRGALHRQSAYCRANQSSTGSWGVWSASRLMEMTGQSACFTQNSLTVPTKTLQNNQNYYLCDLLICVQTPELQRGTVPKLVFAKEEIILAYENCQLKVQNHTYFWKGPRPLLPTTRKSGWRRFTS